MNGKGKICRVRKPYARKVKNLSAGLGSHTHRKGKICRGGEPFAWKGENLQGDGAICTERGKSAG